MNIGDILIPIATFGGGVAGSWFLKPKALAEARKTQAEASNLDWDRFTKEIKRLDDKIAEQAGEIADLKADRDARREVTDKREAENKYLREELSKVKKRLGLLEGLYAQFSVDPNTPPAMLEQIQKLRDVP